MKNERYYGLDILRILCMLGVLGLHVLGRGGILNGANGSFMKESITYFIEILFYPAVNVFAMLTGYLYVQREKIKTKSILNILMTAIFYMVVITGIFYIFNICDIRSFKKMEYIKSIIIPLNEAYWYITSYCLLFFLIPYLNNMIKTLDRQKFQKLLGILLLFFSVITILVQEDVFKIDWGYSVLWLIVCYLLGAYIKIYSKKTNNRMKLLCILILNIVLVLLFRELMVTITPTIFKVKKYENMFMVYNSLYIVINSIILLLLFKDIVIENKHLKKVLENLSKTSFSVYIIHCQYFVFFYFLNKRFKHYVELNLIQMVVAIFSTIIVIYLMCSITDYIRIKLFKLCRVNNLIDRLGHKLDKLIG